jgi:hypothetical protein
MEHLTETFGHSPLVWWIVAAEASFWILLLAGLAVRYLARMRRLSSVILLAVPFVDVSLIALTAWDLSIGAEPNFSHILAALYLGITVGFGHSIIGRVDAWFAHRFAGAEKPRAHPKRGPAHVRRMWAEWGRVVVACVVSSAGITVLALVSHTPLPSSLDGVWEAPLWSVVARFVSVTGIWLLAGPVYAMLFQGARDESDRDGRADGAVRHGTASDLSRGHADAR